VIAVSGVAIGGADELVRESLILGRFCELMAPPAQMLLRAADLFFLGMFSRLDAILQQPMEVILDQVPIADDAKAALLGQPGPLRKVLDLASAYLAGEWNDVDAGAQALGIRGSSLPGMFTAAIEWCEMGLADAREAA
jgi:EAL and modified HD-GYP domain-containing signal transduction protein